MSTPVDPCAATNRLIRCALALVDPRPLHHREAEIQRLLSSASRARRRLTSAEMQRIDRLGAVQSRPPEILPQTLSAAEAELLLASVGRIGIRRARRELDSGLLLTEQMRRIRREAELALNQGNPILLIGETGGAKTALAEHLSGRMPGNNAEFVSGYGDITSAQVIGSNELRHHLGVTVTAFEAGPLLRAMKFGMPLILDEINAMPPEFLKRLNRILQLRPGSTFSVQEQPGLTINIAEGFAIIATANEPLGSRYRGVERLSSELLNRFGAHTYRIHYPDAKRKYTDFPQENALLAAAALADQRGRLPHFVTAEMIERIARVAFISQQVFTGNRGTEFSRYTTVNQELDGSPGLEEAVLAPRTLVALLEKVASSYGVLTLNEALSRFVEGVMHAEDRRVLSFIVEGQGFTL